MARQTSTQRPRVSRPRRVAWLSAALLGVAGGAGLGAIGAFVATKEALSPATAAQGDRALAEKRFSEAVDAFSAALRASPRDASIRLGLARAYFGLGWDREGRAQLELGARGAKETLRQAYLELEAQERKTGNPVEGHKLSDAAASLSTLPY